MASPTQITQMLEVAHEANLVPMILGQPGVGKSSVVYQYGNILNAPVIEFRPNLHDPVDIMGLPHKTTAGTMGYLTPDWLPKAAFCAQHKYVILFIDELPQAVLATQNALSQLILDRRIGNYTLPDNVRQIIAGNRDSDRAGTSKMPTHVANRVMQLTMDFSIEDFLKYCNGTGAAEHLKAFAKFRPQVLENFSPKQKINCTPRSIVGASKIIDAPSFANPTDSAQESDFQTMRFEMVQGLIGEGPAVEYCGFLKIWEAAPDSEIVRREAETYEVPHKLDMQFAVAQMLLIDTDATNVGRTMTFVERLNTEVTQMFVTDLLQRAPDMATDQTIVTWVSNNLNTLAA